MPRLTFALALIVLPACTQVDLGPGVTTGDQSTGTASSSGGSSNTGEVVEGDGSSSTSTSAGSTSSANDSSSSTTTGEGSSTTGDDENSSTGSTGEGSSSTGDDSENSPSSSSSSTGDLDMVCGNWKLEEGERCDDGNNKDGDRCAADCSRYDFYGIDTEIKEEKLVGWEHCWTGTYTKGLPVSGIQESCTGSQLMFACRKVGAQKFVAVAHTSTEDIWTKVNGPQEYNSSNGSAWMLFTPKGEGYLAVSGLGPEFHGCQGGYGMCWPLFTSGESDPVFFYKGHCGAYPVTYADGASWEKVVFQLE